MVPRSEWTEVSEISRFWYVKTRYQTFFLLYLSVYCGDFIEQIKGICHIHFEAKT